MCVEGKESRYVGLQGGAIVFQGGRRDTERTMFVRVRVGWRERVASGTGVEGNLFLKLCLTTVDGNSGVEGKGGMDG